MEALPALIGAAILATLALETREGRMSAVNATLDGGVVIGIATMATRMTGLI